MLALELLLVVRPNLTEQELQQVIQKVEEYIYHIDGKISKVENWGLKRLAYKIEGFDKAYYMLITYSSPYDSSKSLKKILEKDGDILNNIIINKNWEEEE